MASSKEIRAGRAYIELTTKDKLTKGLEAARAKLTAFGSSVSMVGKKLALAGTVAAGLAAICVTSFMKAGDALDKMSGRTGASVEWLSEMKFAAQQSGAAIEDIEVAIKAMNKGFAEAQRGQGKFLQGLKILGISSKSLEKMTIADRFEYLSEQIAGIKDPAMKAKVAIALFGESGTKLLPMVGIIKALREEAKKLGLTISGESATSAAELTDAWGRLTAMFKVFMFEIGSSLAPALKDITAKIQIVFTAILKWVKENKVVVASIAKVIVGVIGLGAGLIILGGIIKGVGLALGALAMMIKIVTATISIMGAVIGFICTPVGLVVTAIVGLSAAVLYYTGAMGEAVNWLGGVWGKLKDFMMETWQGVKDAFEGEDLKLAVKILWLSVKEAWLAGIQPLRETWIGFKSMLSDGWAEVWWGMTEAFSACIYGVKEGWSATIYFLVDCIDAAVYGIIASWNSVTGFMSNAWSACVGGIMKTWNSAMGGMMKAWVRLKGLFSDKIDVEAEITRIDDETVGKNNAQDKSTNKVVRENQARAESTKRERESMKSAIAEARQQEKDQNIRERESDKKAIDVAREAEKQANMDYYSKEMQDTLDALEQARKERKDALEEARKKAEEARKNRTEVELNRGGIETAISETKGSAKGSFYADQLTNVQSNNDSKRTADGVQMLVKETKDTNKILKKQGNSQSLLAFS